MALKLSSPPSGATLARVHVGSAPLSAALWGDIAAWSRAETVNCLGITETANWIGGASSRADGIADGYVGRPWGGSVAVRLDDGRVLGGHRGHGANRTRSPSASAGPAALNIGVSITLPSRCQPPGDANGYTAV